MSEELKLSDKDMSVYNELKEFLWEVDRKMMMLLDEKKKLLRKMRALEVKAYGKTQGSLFKEEVR